MTTPIVSAVFGATGLVGSYAVNALLSLEAFGTVHTITRRLPKQAAATAAGTEATTTASKKLDPIVEPDTAQWVSKLKGLCGKNETESAPPTVVFSSLGTTRQAAGGIANQWKIDHDLNVEVARAAKEAGVGTFVFVSSAGVRSLMSRNVPYSRMKIGVEDTVRELAFDQTIILHPGLILGAREVEHQGAGLFKAVARGLGAVSTWAHDKLAQEAEVIAKAAVHATLLAAQGKAPSKYWELEAADIVRLGRDEWKF